MAAKCELNQYSVMQSKHLAIFDRDDTLIVDPVRQSAGEKISWMPGVLSTLNQLSRNGVDIAIATNQSAIAKGQITLNQVTEFHQKMVTSAKENGISISAIAFCPHHPNFGKRVICECRKPKPGLLSALLSHAPAKEIAFFGDKESDLLAGKAEPTGRIQTVVANSSSGHLFLEVSSWLGSLREKASDL
jgi:D-glycero-D-manno-heptose 1,7-bisphosphate phosphatase